MNCIKLLLLFFLINVVVAQAQVKQADTLLQNIGSISNKFVQQIDKKIDKYSNRITCKTERTLTKLAKWENKIKTSLEKISLKTAHQLFGNNQITFANMLQQLKKGEALSIQFQQQYSQYRDELTNNIKYLEAQNKNLSEGVIKKIKITKDKLASINAKADSIEAIQQFINERKKQLINSAFIYLGKSKYLVNINKEAFYYVEALQNYKEILSNSTKAEAVVKTILNKIPQFRQFIRENSMLATIFGSPSGAENMSNLAGLQTRTSVQGSIQQRIASADASGRELFSKNIQAAQTQLKLLKDNMLKKALNGVVDNGENNMPNFRPNMQKTKTFAQRIEFGANYQFAKSNNLLPTMVDIAATIGYKLNDKSVIGIGGSYKLGLGNIERINFSTQGLSLRTFLDWEIKKGFYASGGMEMNYLPNIPLVNALLFKKMNNWQQSALVGVTKKIKVKTKLFKNSKLSLLYDFLAHKHLPISQTLVFRMGYNF